jgi:hypothetical protein
MEGKFRHLSPSGTVTLHEAAGAGGTGNAADRGCILTGGSNRTGRPQINAFRLGAGGSELRNFFERWTGNCLFQSVFCRLALWRHASLLGARATYNDDGSLEYIRHIAGTAKMTGVGNCTEKSAVAFMFLHDKNPNITRPLNWCSVGNGAHMFVVIGTISGPKSFINQPNTWPDDTIVCDPWNEVVHDGKSWSSYQSDTNIVQEYCTK